MKTHFIILWAILFLSSVVFGQEDFKILDNGQLKFEGFSSKEGLKHHSITTMSQDEKGYMWFGTFNGIYKRLWVSNTTK